MSPPSVMNASGSWASMPNTVSLTTPKPLPAALPLGADWKNVVACEFETSAKSKMRLTDRPISAPGRPLIFWLMRALKW